MKSFYATYAVCALMLVTASPFAPAHGFSVKDQMRLPGMNADGKPDDGLQQLAPLGPLVPPPGDGQPPAGSEQPPGGSEGARPQEPAEDQAPSAGIELMETVEQVALSDDSAKRAIDAFIKLKTSYQDTDIGEYETLEQFVAEAREGPALEADIKRFGFKTVGEWNRTIMSVSFAYAAISSSQEQEILQEIENIRGDNTLEEGLKKSLIDGLQSMLPSEANKDVVSRLNEDPSWAEKLSALTEDDTGERDH